MDIGPDAKSAYKNNTNILQYTLEWHRASFFWPIFGQANQVAQRIFYTMSTELNLASTRTQPKSRKNPKTEWF